MNVLAELVLTFVVLTNLALLVSSRLAGCIKLIAFQGMVLGLFPLFLPEMELNLRLLLLCVAVFGLKGMVFPRLLTRSLRAADVRHEVEPFIGYTMSVVLGVLMLVLSMWLLSSVRFSPPDVPPLGFPVALSTVLIGLLLIVGRRKALTQVVGYLVMENGIYIAGLLLIGEQPLVVELGVLLDVFVAVFVMGIAMFHINQEFSDIDVHELNRLKG